ncbi:MAG: PAS domain S-box protein [Thermodesulfobacteriota bacterium]|nr:PAS domain S-box protein [Thermodesulfobacteriota bacterium]
MEDDTRTQLAEQLKAARSEVAHYREIAEEVGKVRLRETEELSQLISELRQAQELLKQRNTELDSFINNIPDMAWLKDARSRFIAVNRAFGEAVGMDPKTLVGQTVEVCYGKEKADAFREHDRRVMEAGKRVVLEERFADSENGETWVEAIKSPILDDSGRVTGTAGIARDISHRKRMEMALQKAHEELEKRVKERTAELLEANTTLKHEIAERKRAEMALRKSEERFRRLFEHSNDAVIIHESGKILDVNQSTCEMLGYSREQLVSMSIFDLHPEEDRPECLGKINTIRAGRGRQFETQWMRADGTMVDVEVSSRVVDPENGIVQGLGRDISRRKEIQDELLKTKKLESIGMLAGGIAHDYNNLLSIILGSISMAREDLKPEYGISEFLKEAEKACFRAKNLTRQLVTFSKGGAPIKETAPVSELIRESARHALRGSSASLDFSASNGAWLVDYDKGQMEDVITYLVTNAHEAMPGDGVIKVRVENVHLGGEHQEPGLSFQEGRYVRISVQDKGVGIPEQLLPSIFDPYFSTKEMGDQKGMGLGLATAYSIIKRHDGHIGVESKVGVGTTFRVYLPASEKGLLDEKDGHREIDRLPSTAEKILVMEDEEMLRDLTGKMLERLGYEVQLTKDGGEAVGLYKAAMDAGVPFDGAILDLTVPGGMGGKQALRKLCEMDPKVKAIVSSGYSDDPVMTDWRQHGFVGAIVKPYQKKDLREVLLKAFSDDDT